LACGPGKFVLGTEFAGLWIQDTLRQKFFPVSVQDILKRGGSGFMETYVQDQLLLGHGNKYPRGVTVHDNFRKSAQGWH
jgi:hypothetical protein